MKQNFRIVSKRVPELSDQEFKDCYRLNMRDRGSMRDELNEQRMKRNNRAVLVYEDDLLVGWSLRFRENWGGDRFKKNPTSLYIYVRRSYRKQGIGKFLLGRARMGNYTGRVRVFPHTTAANGLYRSAISNKKVVPGW